MAVDTAGLTGGPGPTGHCPASGRKQEEITGTMRTRPMTTAAKTETKATRTHVERNESGQLPTRPRTRMPASFTDAERFFWQHGGYSIAQGETEQQGRVRSARELARAEEWAAKSADGYTFRVMPDPDADESFMDGESAEYRDRWSGTAWAVVMLSIGGEAVQSLCGCFGDDDYKRVVKAELALEQMAVDAEVTEAIEPPTRTTRAKLDSIVAAIRTAGCSMALDWQMGRPRPTLTRRNPVSGNLDELRYLGPRLKSAQMLIWLEGYWSGMTEQRMTDAEGGN